MRLTAVINQQLTQTSFDASRSQVRTPHAVREPITSPVDLRHNAVPRQRSPGCHVLTTLALAYGRDGVMMEPRRSRRVRDSKTPTAGDEIYFQADILQAKQWCEL